MNDKAEELKEYYICYFDILGYKDFFKDESNDPQKLLIYISEVVEKIKKRLSLGPMFGFLDEVFDLSVSVKSFSDNFILCLEKKDTEYESLRMIFFLWAIADIQRGFVVEYGLFVRGGICCGLVSINDDFVFGKGLVDVVGIEETTGVPRIEISSSFYEQLSYCYENRHGKDEKITDSVKSRVSSVDVSVMATTLGVIADEQIYDCFDKKCCVSYLYYIDFDSVFGQIGAIAELKEYIADIKGQNKDDLFPDSNVVIRSVLERHKKMIVERIIKYGSFIEHGDIEKELCRERILKKYVWVMKYHNDMCNRYGCQDFLISSEANIDSRSMALTISVIE